MDITQLPAVVKVSPFGSVDKYTGDLNNYETLKEWAATEFEAVMPDSMHIRKL